MSTAVEIFEQVCTQRGDKVLLPSRMTPPQPFAVALDASRRWMASMGKLFKPNRKIDIHFDFIDNGEFNAWASFQDPIGLVAYYRGTVCLPQDTFYRMFSHPAILPAIGHSAAEIIVPQHREEWTENFDTLTKRRFAAGRPTEALAPKDLGRKGVALLCAYIALEFISFHELVHILHGHLRYLTKTRKCGLILEVPPAASGAGPIVTNNLVEQAIEMWADHVGLVACLTRFLAGRLGDIKVEAIISTAEQRLFIWCFTIAWVFRMWDFRIDPSELYNDHPPGGMRLFHAIAAAYDELAAKYPSLSQNFAPICCQAIRELDRAVALIGGPELTREDLIGAFDQINELLSNVVDEV